MVPNGWSLVKLGDILTLGSGDMKPDDLQKSIPMIHHTLSMVEITSWGTLVKRTLLTL